MPSGGTPTQIPSNGVPDSFPLLLQGLPVSTQRPHPGPSHMLRRPRPALGEHGGESPANSRPDPARTPGCRAQSQGGGSSSAGQTGHRSSAQISVAGHSGATCHLETGHRVTPHPGASRGYLGPSLQDPCSPREGVPRLAQALDPPPSLSQRGHTLPLPHRGPRQGGGLGSNYTSWKGGPV